METTVATLLLVTSAVILACVAINYAVDIFLQTLDTTNLPQLDRIRDLEAQILNQTSNLFNQTETELTNSTLP
jgi:hypothetical protein